MPRVSDNPLALSWLVSGTERVDVHDGGMTDAGPVRPGVVLSVVDRVAIAELLDLIEVTSVPDGMCMCLGTSTLEFHEHGRVLARVGLHHASHLRWAGWVGDAVLADGAGLAEWLAERGYRAPLDDLRRTRALHAEFEADAARWSAAIPPAVSDLGPALLETSRTGHVPSTLLDDLAEQLTTAVPDDVQRCRELLVWCGAGSGRRSGYPVHEGVPGLLLARVPVDTVVAAIEARPADPAALRGAIRHLTGWRSRPGADLDRIPRRAWNILVEDAAASGDADTWQTIVRSRDEHS